MTYTYLFLVFMVTTLLEIYFLIKVGELVGAFNTILLIILTAIIGSIMVKTQGINIIQKAHNQVTKRIIPTFEILEGVVILVSGVLLLTPGFLTDLLGLLGLIPVSRKYMINAAIKYNFVRYDKTKKSTDDDYIEAKYWQE